MARRVPTEQVASPRTSRIVAALLACAFAHTAGAQGAARSCSPPSATQLIVLPDEGTITQARILESPVRPGAGIAFYLSLGAPIAAAPLNIGTVRYAVLSYSPLVVSRGAPFWAAPARGASVGAPCGAPLQPVYRLYNHREGEARPNHRYTISPVLAGQLVARGWTNEGIAFCAAS